MPLKRRAVMCLFLLPLALLMATKLRSQSRAAAAKQAKPAPNRKSPGALRALSTAQRQWADNKLRSMTVDEKIGQLLFPTYHGTFTAIDSPAYQQMLHDVRDLHAGGFILATRMAIAAGGDPRDAYTMGKITALEARQAGVHWIYAPVADVNNNPGNPIINTRSFGEDAARVSEFVSAYVRGVEENGGLATAKHFPGHGDTAADSHIDRPVIRADRQRLDSMELVPFRAAIAAGAGSVMTGHLSVPALEPDP